MKRTLIAVVLAAVLPVTALAQSPVVTGIGPRVGVSIDPDQFVFGGQVYFGEVAPDLSLEPNLEIGIGDDVTVVAVNFDMLYHFSIQGSAWRPYAGAGLGVNFISWDAPAPLQDDSDTEVGANLILGAGAPTQSGNRFFTELRFGLGDIPELKLMVGWNFKM